MIKLERVAEAVQDRSDLSCPSIASSSHSFACWLRGWEVDSTRPPVLLDNVPLVLKGEMVGQHPEPVTMAPHIKEEGLPPP